ncbi:MAG TPA: exodeoxyribonuclease III [Euzebyales bacterium]
MRLITYNVNSISTRLTRVLALLDDLGPDVVCLQETKCTAENFPHGAFEEHGYVAADHSAGRWAGVAVLARGGLGFSDVQAGLRGEPAVDEARWVEATVGDVRVVSTYVPNGQALDSPAFKQKLLFLEAMRERAAELADGPAIIAGDLNVCPTDLDVWDPSAVHGATHITDDERSRLRAVVDTGFVDAFRRLHPDEPGFTWWDYRAGHFHKGFGLRIDLALVSEGLAGRLTDSVVQRPYRKPTKVPGTKPSDHAPLVVDFAGS